MQVQTLDNMFAKGIVTDAIAYLESVPDHLIPGKSRLLESLRRRKEEQDEMQRMPAGDADTCRDPACRRPHRAAQLLQPAVPAARQTGDGQPAGRAARWPAGRSAADVRNRRRRSGPAGMSRGFRPPRI